MYLTAEEYRQISAKIPDEELNNLLTMSSMSIDRITFYRIKSLSALSPFQQSAIKNACAYQADYLYANGIDRSHISSYSVGGMSVTLSEETEASRNNFSQLAYDLVKSSGLLWRGLY